MEAVIDTNVLIYDIIEDSIFHEKVSETLDKLEKWLIPSVVIEEFVLVLDQLKIDKEIIGRKVEEILKNSKSEIIPVEKEDLLNANFVVSAEKISFKNFNDKIILSVAKRKKAKIFTFDLKLRKECKKYEIDLL